MKLFIDTSNKYLILGLINDKNKVVDFFKYLSNKDLVSKTNKNIQVFLNKNKVKLNDITDFYITTGPGSYTGLKIAYNVVKTIKLVNKDINVYTADSLDVQRKDKQLSIINLTSTNYAYKAKNKSTIELTSDTTKLFKNDDYAINMDHFNKEILEEKINSKTFKFIDNLDSIELLYLNDNFKRK